MLLLFLWSVNSAMLLADHRITIRVDNYTNDTCTLAYYSGENQYVQATVTSKNADNEFIFEGDKALEGDLYFVLLQTNSNNRFDFAIPNEADQKKLVLSTTLEEERTLLDNLEVEGSQENTVFVNYMKENIRVNKEK